MDEIKKRLQETSETCFNHYEAWRKDEKNSEERASLIEAIHELRKVASRLEIELAISERDEMAKKPIPIPPHRDARRRSPEDEVDGNSAAPAPRSGPKKGGGQRRRSPSKKPPSANA